MPPRIVQTLDAFGSLLVGLVGLLLAWRTAAGAITVMESGETSMILGIPQWISQAPMVPGFCTARRGGHLHDGALLGPAQRADGRG